MSREFNISNHSIVNEPKVQLGEFEVIGYGSYDEDYNFKFDLSQLPYFNPPPKESWDSIQYDLNINFENTKRNPHFKTRKLDDLLRWILHNLDKVEETSDESRR